MPLSLRRHRHASMRSVTTDRKFEQDLRGRRQAELEEEMRLLARDHGVQIARRRKRLKDRPAATAQSDVANALGAFLDSCVAEEAATEEGERRELKRQRRETERKQRAANAAKALSRVHARPRGRAANQRELAAASSSARTATAAAAATIPKAQMSESEPATRLRPWEMSRKGRGARGQWICFEIEMKRSPPVP
jgi:hypothetical protein